MPISYQQALRNLQRLYQQNAEDGILKIAEQSMELHAFDDLSPNDPNYDKMQNNIRSVANLCLDDKLKGVLARFSPVYTDFMNGKPVARASILQAYRQLNIAVGEHHRQFGATAPFFEPALPVTTGDDQLYTALLNQGAYMRHTFRKGAEAYTLGCYIAGLPPTSFKSRG